jgi:hypothetical protein
MKKLILLAGLYCLQPNLHAASFGIPVKNNISPKSAIERAKAHFKVHYEEAQHVAWFNLGENNMFCVFHQGDTANRVFYDKRGYWKYTLLSYPGYYLPIRVKEFVSDYYKCYQISYVNEIRSSYNEPVYVINIENDDNIKVIKVAGDEIEVQQVLEKK